MFGEPYKNITDALEKIKESADWQENCINNLREENARLKDEKYKDIELAKLKEQLDKTRKAANLGFPITEEENEAIKKWTDEHIRSKHWDKTHNMSKSFGAIGGNFTYEFVPTSIGTIGTIRCSCGKYFTFQEP